MTINTGKRVNRLGNDEEFAYNPIKFINARRTHICIIYYILKMLRMMEVPYKTSTPAAVVDINEKAMDRGAFCYENNINNIADTT